MVYCNAIWNIYTIDVIIILLLTFFVKYSQAINAYLGRRIICVRTPAKNDLAKKQIIILDNYAD